MGGKLGTLFAKVGHDVVFSYAHSSGKLEQLANTAGKNARAGTPREATEDADVVLLAVHWSRVDDVLEQAGDLSGKIIISCTLPMNRDDTALVVAHTTSGAEAIARKTACYIEPASLLIPKIAYDGDSGPAVAYRFEYLEDRS